MRDHSVTHRAPFEALADGTRRAMLEHLRRTGALAVNDIAAQFSVSRPAISRHLRILREARLVRGIRRGRLHVYRLDARPLQTVDRWLEPYRRFWNDRLAGLKAFIDARAAEGPMASRGATRRPRRRR